MFCSRLRAACLGLFAVAGGCTIGPPSEGSGSFIAEPPAHVVTAFGLWESSVEQFTPFVLEIETAGPYAPGSEVVRVSIVATDETPALTLFDFQGEELAKQVVPSWSDTGELRLSDGGDPFQAEVASEYGNGWGDTSVNPEDFYSFTDVVLHEDLRPLLEQQSFDDPRWNDELRISNMDAEEDCLWGVPVLRSGPPEPPARVVTKFELWEASVDAFTPFVLEIETAGPYAPGSEVVRVSIVATDETPALTLFDFHGEELAKQVVPSWTDKGELRLSDGGDTFQAEVASEYGNGWGDTSVNPDDFYSFTDAVVLHTDLRPLLEQHSFDDPRWDDELRISNMDAEEDCLWGVPVLQSAPAEAR